jgi:hypothetical protein
MGTANMTAPATHLTLRISGARQGNRSIRYVQRQATTQVSAVFFAHHGGILGTGRSFPPDGDGFAAVPERPTAGTLNQNNR